MLGDYLFGTVKLTKTSDSDKYIDIVATVLDLIRADIFCCIVNWLKMLLFLVKTIVYHWILIMEKANFLVKDQQMY